MQSLSQLRVELLVVAVQTVDVTLGLGASASHFKADKTLVHTVVQSLKAGHTNVLKRVLHTRNEVRDELGDGTTVEDGAGDTLGDQNVVLLREVPSGTGVTSLTSLAGLLVFHDGDTTHATVGLDKLAFVADEVFTGGLGGTSEKTTHHDGGGTHSKTLDNVTNVLDTTVGNARNTEASGESRDAADGGGLRTADSHDLLGDTSTTAAHANSQAIDTGGNQSRGLLTSHDVSANDINLREGLLDPFDHLNLVQAVTLAAVQDNNVETGLDEQREAVLVVVTGTDGGSTDQLLRLGELGGKRVVEVLHQVTAREQRDQVSALINDGELALLRATENLVGLGQSGTGRGRNKIGGHDGGDGVVKFVVELDVTAGDHADELGAEGTVLCAQ